MARRLTAKQEAVLHYVAHQDKWTRTGSVVAPITTMRVLVRLGLAEFHPQWRAMVAKATAAGIRYVSLREAQQKRARKPERTTNNRSLTMETATTTKEPSTVTATAPAKTAPEETDITPEDFRERLYTLADQWQWKTTKESLANLGSALDSSKSYLVSRAEILKLALPNNLICEVVLVTPKLAKKWLRSSQKNRKLNPSKVSRIIQELMEKFFVLNGEPIIFNKDGILHDGHHRLVGVALSGESVEILVVWGVDPDTFSSLDQGQARSPSDVLVMSKIPNATSVAGLLRLILLFEYRGGVNHVTGFTGVNNRTIEELLKKYPDAPKSVDTTLFNGGARLGLRKTSAYFAHYLLSRIDPVFAEEFWRGLITGESLYVGDPRIRLERTLSSVKRGDIRSAKGGTRETDYISYIFKAWNSWINGRTLKTFVKGDLLGIMPEGVEALRGRHGRFDLTLKSTFPDRFYSNPRHKDFLGSRYIPT